MDPSRIDPLEVIFRTQHHTVWRQAIGELMRESDKIDTALSSMWEGRKVSATSFGDVQNMIKDRRTEMIAGLIHSLQYHNVITHSESNAVREYFLYKANKDGVSEYMLNNAHQGVQIASLWPLRKCLSTIFQGTFKDPQTKGARLQAKYVKEEQRWLQPALANFQKQFEDSELHTFDLNKVSQEADAIDQTLEVSKHLKELAEGQKSLMQFFMDVSRDEQLSAELALMAQSQQYAASTHLWRFLGKTGSFLLDLDSQVKKLLLYQESLSALAARMFVYGVSAQPIEQPDAQTLQKLKKACSHSSAFNIYGYLPVLRAIGGSR